jgi:hypothetical protein
MTISEHYLNQQIKLHEDPNYGIASIQYAPLVADIMKKIEAKSISDYGAGKKNLYFTLKNFGLGNFEYFPYDPAFPEYGEAKIADLVCCIDVLEHIEPNYVNDVIDALANITKNIGFYTIATGPALKILNDGRNAHLIQEPSSWWLAKLVKHFDIIELRSYAHNAFWVIVKPIKTDPLVV